METKSKFLKASISPVIKRVLIVIACIAVIFVLFVVYQFTLGSDTINMNGTIRRVDLERVTLDVDP